MTPASFDESLLTGESRPVAHQPGDAVLAGSVPVDRAVRLRVTASGAATRLSALARLVQRAQEHRPRVARDWPTASRRGSCSACSSSPLPFTWPGARTMPRAPSRSRWHCW